MSLHSQKSSQHKRLQKFNALWTRKLGVLRRQAGHMARRYFPRFEADEVVNETYLRLIRRLQKAIGKPLDLDRLMGIIHVCMRNALHDLLRREQRENKLKQRFGQQVINHQNYAASPPTLNEEEVQSWREKFRSALMLAWEGISLKDKETQSLRTWLTAHSTRQIALELLGLQHATDAEKQMSYDQPLHRAKRILQLAFRPIREWIAQMDDHQMGIEFAAFLTEQLADAPARTLNNSEVEPIQ